MRKGGKNSSKTSTAFGLISLLPWQMHMLVSASVAPLVRIPVWLRFTEAVNAPLARRCAYYGSCQAWLVYAQDLHPTVVLPVMASACGSFGLMGC